MNVQNPLNMKTRTGVSIVRIAFSIIVTLFLAAGLSRVAAAAEFFGLGVPFGGNLSYAYDVSADGSVVVGTVGVNGQACRWTP
jgi:hypothetical protein